MENQYSRTELLIGKDGIEKLKKAKIAIFGIGGVGSFVAEGLVRAGVGKFILIDHDEITVSNLNRQIHATQATIGKSKVEVMKQRMLEINPNATIETVKEFFLPEKEEKKSFKIQDKKIDYVIDAVDTVTAKIELVMQANRFHIPIISAMGTGNKLDPTRFEIADLYSTSVCPLAKVMRKELKARGITKLKVVYSKEEPIKLTGEKQVTERSKQIPGSISFVPSVAGLIIASEVVKDLIRRKVQ